MPNRISSYDLPTPLKIIFFGSAPTCKTLFSSPPDTTSKPQPFLLINSSIEILLKDLTEKQIRLSLNLNAFLYTSTCLSKVFFEHDPIQTQQYSQVWHYSDWAKQNKFESNSDR